MASIITITCYPDRPLASVGDINIILPSRQRAESRPNPTFTVMQMGALRVIWMLSGRSLAELSSLPDIAADVMHRYQSQCLEIGKNPTIKVFTSWERVSLWASERSQPQNERNVTDD
jgi:hypothetical protein